MTNRRKQGVISAICFCLIFVTIFLAPARGQVYDSEALKRSKLPKSPQAVASGEVLYREKCSFCHGLKGDGNGPVADYIEPRPRDFTKGLFKFRETRTGELPTDEDLFRTISKGVPGTSMPAWGEGEFKLSHKAIWQLVYYIKTFSSDFADPQFNPYEFIYKVQREIPSTQASILKGKELFQDKKKGACVKCHGTKGRGNGSEAGTQKDDWGYPILPADLTNPWRYKGGKTTREIFQTLSTGLNGTPMPGYEETLSEEERWSIAHYVDSLVETGGTGVEVALKSKFIEGEIPANPDDPIWKTAQKLEVPLSGQVIKAPRWENHSVDMLNVRSVHNIDEIAFLVSWNDRFKDVNHEDPPELPSEVLKDTYIPTAVQYERRRLKLRDALAVQFPVKISEGTVKPYFFLGQRGNPVNLWFWKADMHRDGSENRWVKSVDELNREGFNTKEKMQPPESQAVVASAAWDDGRWKVILKRALRTEDKKGDIQFEPNIFIPIAFQVWDGSNGEYGLQCSISSWYYVYMEYRTPLLVFLYAIAGGIGVLAVEFWAVRKARTLTQDDYRL